MRQRESTQVTLDGAGDGELAFGPVPLGTVWYVERISIDGQGTPDVTVYASDPIPQGIVDFSDGAPRNIADESSPIFLNPGESLIIGWEGGTAATVATAVVQVNAVSESLDRAAEAKAKSGRAIVTQGFGGDGMLPAW